MSQVQVEQKTYQMSPRDGFTVAHFITVADVERSLRFYETVFGGRILTRGNSEGAPVGAPALINDVIAAVDVKCLAGDQPSGIVSEERGGNAHVVDADEAPCRCFRLRLVQ